MSKRRNATILIVLIVAVLITGYAFFNARLLLIGPEIIVESPQNGTSFNEPFIELHGKALHTSFISLNGQQLFVDETSTFRVPLVLAPGTSIMKLNARDRFNRETELTLWYTYRGDVLQPATHTIPALVATSSDDVMASSTATSSIDE